MLPLLAFVAISGFSRGTCSLPEAQQGGYPDKFGEWKTLEDLATAVRKQNRLPSVCIACQVIGKPAEDAVVGVRNKQNPAGEVEADDHFLLGPIGEAMTATLVAKLIDDQKFGWKTTLENALPGFKMQDAYKKVTIEQLLQHQSGFPIDLRLSQDDVERITAKANTATEARKAFVTDLLMREPITLASGVTSYSNADYVVLGYLMELLIHQSFEWLMQRNIFNPMKMFTAMVAPVGSDDQFGSPRNPVGHVLGDFGYAPYEMPVSKLDWIMAPAGMGMSCSVGDLVKFAAFHLRGLQGDAQVLKEETYKHLHTPLPGAIGEKFSCGWMIDPNFAHEACQTREGNDGSFCADMTIWPERNLVAVAFTNAGTTMRPSPTMQAILSLRNKVEKKN